ncbi:Spo0E family sporulation regulatory protein-aspartic acid phosphatase [Metabacillus halosaccharovorans]|uniref:Spo0E family sporulation regulatory protein-aspartic acid phosphatase n=1 Tax=Metabacillus halosaccharovorans TaxID=930124 RepID=UPI00203EB3D5|nr:Spo0E family sporulation regulatory protein-aspartic acid phosphatase [Metabacillus halosaccharovorans]MCM3443527.1 Spo0E family sporulation regulatory protein-aspartic acid phosphatase [Metabacillus halosaccharovorans]
MVTALTSELLESLESQLEKSILELKEEIRKNVQKHGLNSTRTIGKSKQLDKYIYEMQLLKQMRNSL